MKITTYKDGVVVSVTGQDDPIQIPQTITPRQFRLALLAINQLAAVETLALSDKVIGIWFEYSISIERQSQELINGATALGLTSTDIDNLFLAADKL